jgi:hypothetical protein
MTDGIEQVLSSLEGRFTALGNKEVVCRARKNWRRDRHRVLPLPRVDREWTMLYIQ